MKQIVTIVGARPQFVKAAVVSKALREVGGIDEKILHTGQHYNPEMSEVFFKELDIPEPHWNLQIGSGSHGEQTGRMLIEIERSLLAAKPDMVMLYGDTNSTLAGAIVASKLGIPVAHVEAGLRSFNRSMPEEINRIVTDRLSCLLFAPTKLALKHLSREGISNDDSTSVVNTGDVMYDAFLTYSKNPPTKQYHSMSLGSSPYLLATIHRAENTDSRENLANILAAMIQLKQRLRVVFLLHPRTAARIKTDPMLQEILQQIETHAPLGYLDMIHAERNAAVILTDSGGVQKEADFAKTPCVTLRTETEWTETVQAGWNRVVPDLTPENILSEVINAIGTTGDQIADYGNGHASSLIAEHVVKFLSK